MRKTLMKLTPRVDFQHLSRAFFVRLIQNVTRKKRSYEKRAQKTLVKLTPKKFFVRILAMKNGILNRLCILNDHAKMRQISRVHS
jgi:hypothetical protein